MSSLKKREKESEKERTTIWYGFILFVSFIVSITFSLWLSSISSLTGIKCFSLIVFRITTTCSRDAYQLLFFLVLVRYFHSPNTKRHTVRFWWRSRMELKTENEHTIFIEVQTNAGKMKAKLNIDNQLNG